MEPAPDLREDTYNQRERTPGKQMEDERERERERRRKKERKKEKGGESGAVRVRVSAKRCTAVL